MGKDNLEPSLLSLPQTVRWFRPTLLANAAMRAAISPVFGTFADQRMMQATIDGFARKDLAEVARRHRYSETDVADETGAVWIDYLADTADGFDSTYAMASLVAADTLKVRRRGDAVVHELPTGKILFFGGDQVYPFPSRQAYEERFVTPFRMAFASPTKPRRAFAIPGNHDWYDGLNSFDYLFCQARYGVEGGGTIAGLTFPQHRSYFAVRLPHNWWIWGVDVQFSEYLDVGQVRYFQAIAAEMRERQPDEPEHKIIICIAEPGWQYEDALGRYAKSNIEIVADVARSGHARVCAVLSGDTHHYCRYYNPELNLNLITAGGGGAFLHPTHQLSPEVGFTWDGAEHKFTMRCKPRVKGPGMEPSAFPKRSTSFWLTWGNWLFPFLNYTFATLLGTLYWVMTWMYAQTPVNRETCEIMGVRNYRPLVEDVLVNHPKECGLNGKNPLAIAGDLVAMTVQAGVHQFLLGMFALVLLFALIQYADAQRRWVKVVMGLGHWLAHMVAMVLLYLAVNYWGYWEYFGETTRVVFEPYLGDSVRALKTAAYVGQMIFGGGIVAGMVWGVYLFLFCAFGRRHWNEAFSALRLQNYKNFLRIKLEPDRATIYPIGLRRVPNRVEWLWRKGPEGGGRYMPLRPLSPELVDGPVVIDVADVRRRQGPIT